MRIALLSDVHGNLAGLCAVASTLDRTGPFDHVIVAGDLLQGGPRPRAVWSMLVERGWTLLRGNEDDALVAEAPLDSDYPERFRMAARRQIAWTREQLGAELLNQLAALSTDARIETPAGTLLVVHSSPRGVADRAGGIENTTADITEAYGGTGAAAIAFGHYHRNFVRWTPFGLLINVASVGLPTDDLPLAAYTIVHARSDGMIVEQRHAPYNPDEELAAAAETGMPPWEPD